MDFRSALDQFKQVFVLGKNNPYLHGRQTSQTDHQGYEQDKAYQGAQPAYAQDTAFPQQGYQQPQVSQAQPYNAQDPYQQGYQQPVYQQPVYQQPVYQQPAYQQPAYQQPVYQQPVYQQPQQASAAPEQPAFQSQFNPESFKDSGRNRRSQQHQEQAGYQSAGYQQPQAAVPENLVPFPGAKSVPETRMVDAYVINVFNINSCRQAMSCLRKGQCTLIVMDQLVDKAEIRRYVDMLTGACYALNGTMTRLSSRIGFYIMAPSGMTVYTDPTTSNANAQPRPQQAPLYRAPAASVPGQRPPQDFSMQQGYGAVPQMQFAPQQGEQSAPQGKESYQQDGGSTYPSYEEPAPRYAAL
jgi:FtsZ-interacting cell division protein YlmF